MKLRLLTYHETSLQPPASDVHVLAQREFNAQIDLLCACRIPVADARCLSDASLAHPYAIGLTFDDGTSSDLDNARYLHARGLTGMFFVSTDNIGKPGFLSRQQILEMQGMGMVIGSHGQNHRAFDIMGIDQARRQMVTSRAVLEDLLGRQVDHLAFPGGRHDRPVVDAAYEVGYRFLFTMIWGVNQVVPARPTLFRRDVVVRGMSNEDFLDLIAGRNAWGRQAIYWCKQAARGLLPSSIYGTLRRRFISG